MRRLAVLTAVVACLLPAQAGAVQEWYDYYLSARDSKIPAESYEQAVEELLEAIRLKPAPALREQTYGLRFVDYLPYYYLGLCYLRLDRFDEAIRMFNIEEDRGVIRRSELHTDLVALRADAQNAEEQRAARLARAEVGRMVREARSSDQSGEEQRALAILAEAQVAAARLDPEIQRAVAELQKAIRDRIASSEQAAERRGRIDAGLAQGRSLLESNPTEAIVHFDQVLSLDPGNRVASDGKAVAQRSILAQTTRANRRRAFDEGRSLAEAGQYQRAIRLLTDASADPTLEAARDWLERAISAQERLREQRALLQKVADFEREAEELIEANQFREAYVRIDTVLRLDPGNVRAQERLAEVEQRIGQDFLGQFLPNRRPSFVFFDPSGIEEGLEGGSLATGVDMEGDRVKFVGVASDDRGVSRVEFRIGDRIVGEERTRPGLDATRYLRFDRDFPVEPGLNTFSVTATDSGGLSAHHTFRVTRNLRFYETRAFLPSVLGTAVGFLGLGLGVQHLRRRRAVRRRFNPYIAGAPVLDDDMFFGRQKLLSRILNVLHHNSLVITGERRIGKTTFLYHLKRALEADQDTDYRFFPVMTDLQGVPESGFFHAVMSDIVDGLSLPQATLDGMRFLPDRESYDGRDFSNDVRLVIDELKTRTSGRVRLALLIDEVDVLNEYSERINQRLRSIFMKTFSEHLVAVMSGVGIRRTWSSEGSPWYNFFDEMELAGLSRQEAEALIRSPVEKVFRYDAAAVEAILHYSDLKPYLIQKFCIHVINHIIEERRTTVTVEDVEAVREDAVRFEGQGPGRVERVSA